MLRVLLVEDNPGDARLVRELLREIGDEAQLTDVAMITQAMAALARNTFDVLLLDLGLPDSVGLDGLGRIAKQSPAVAIVVLTGLNDTALALDALKAGAQDYLPKGKIDGELLARVLRYAVERKRLEIVREQLITELQDALAHVKTLSGLLPICAYCKKIRDDQGYWSQVERYVSERSDARFTHGVCPVCKTKIEGEISALRNDPRRS